MKKKMLFFLSFNATTINNLLHPSNKESTQGILEGKAQLQHQMKFKQVRGKAKQVTKSMRLSEKQPDPELGQQEEKEKKTLKQLQSVKFTLKLETSSSKTKFYSIVESFFYVVFKLYVTHPAMRVNRIDLETGGDQGTSRLSDIK